MPIRCTFFKPQMYLLRPAAYRLTQYSSVRIALFIRELRHHLPTAPLGSKSHWHQLGIILFSDQSLTIGLGALREKGKAAPMSIAFTD